MDALPLTVNGKLDTRALPAPEYRDGDRYRAPADAVEEILADIYAQVLGLERVGVDESFFELGGDSILSMQVVARARAAGVVCRPRDIFVEQTVARLARVAVVGDGDAEVIDEGVGPVVATPIISWLHSVERPGRPLQPDGGGAGPDGGDRGRCGGGSAGLAGSACDAAAAGRRRRRGGLVADGARGGVGGCPRLPAGGGGVVGGGLDRGAVAVEPGGRGDGERVVGCLGGSVGGDRSPFGCRRGVVADFARGPQHRLGPASGWAAGGVAGGRGRRLPGGRRCWPSMRAARKSWSRRRCGGRSRRCLLRCRRCNLRWIPM